MYLLKRIFNIIQADVNTFLDKLERRQATQKQNSNRRYNDWRKSFNGFRSSETRSNHNYSNSRNYNNNDKLVQYYANLEISYGSDLETVKKAWKDLVKKYHPDLHSNNPEKREIANNLTSKLNEAYREIEKSLNCK